MKKISLSVVALLLSALFVFSAFTPVARAEGGTSSGSSQSEIGTKAATDFPYKTEFTITDNNGKNLIGQTDVSKSAQVHLNYKFEVPNNVDLIAGDSYFVMQIPKEIVTQNISDIKLTEDDKADGKLIATVHISPSGDVTIVFESDAVAQSDIKGHFSIDTSFNSAEIGNSDPVKIVFTVAGESVTIPIGFVQPTVKVEKSGIYNGKDNTIEWTVKVNGDKASIENAVLTDDIPIGQQYVESPGAKISPDATGSFGYDSTADTTKTGTLTYTFGGIISDTYTITFKTKVTDAEIFKTEDKTTDVKNKAVLTYGSGKTVNSEATVQVKTDFISKEGYQDPNDKTKIIWTITINSNAQPITDATVKDTIPDGLALVEGTVFLDGSTTPLTTADYEYTLNVFTYQFTGAINEPHTIQFSTQITDPDYFKKNGATFYNKATLTGTGVPSNALATKEVGVGNNIIQKDAQGYDTKTQEITWKITVNTSKQNLTSVKVTDTIPDGLKYVEDSATITPAGLGSFTTLPDTTNKILTYDFGTGTTINSTYSIIFKTTVTDAAIFANNATKDYWNTAKLLVGELLSSDAAKQTVNSQVIEKTSAGYDYANKIVTWKIIANRNKMKLTNANVTDIIPNTLTFVPGSVTINGNPASAGNYSYDNPTKKFTYHLGDISDTQTITFQTKITDLSVFVNNGDVKLKNIATLTDNEYSTGVSSEGTATIKNTIVSKNADYETGNDYIDWMVNVNSNKVALSNVTLTDILQEGLELNTSSVQMYRQTLNPDGTLTVKDQVSYPASNITYKPDTREIVFTLPSSSEAYLLTFRTNITDKTKSPFANSISFAGTGANSTSDSHIVDIKDQSYGGGASASNGSITVIKVDNADSSKTLAGAVFQLLDSSQTIKATSLLTGSDGTIKFDKLKFDRIYYVKEITAPDGYNLSSEEHPFMLTSATDGKNITYSFKDTKKSPTGGGGNPSSSEVSSVASSMSSIVSSTSSNPNENIGDDGVGKAGASSKPASGNPNENIGDDGVGKAGGSPKTGESNTYLPIIIALMLAAAVVLILGTYRSRRSKKVQ